jgi:hypothetical protein
MVNVEVGIRSYDEIIEVWQKRIAQLPSMYDRITRTEGGCHVCREGTNLVCAALQALQGTLEDIRSSVADGDMDETAATMLLNIHDQWYCIVDEATARMMQAAHATLLEQGVVPAPGCSNFTN